VTHLPRHFSLPTGKKGPKWKSDTWKGDDGGVYALIVQDNGDVAIIDGQRGERLWFNGPCKDCP
jgi:hypothetical protein